MASKRGRAQSGRGRPAGNFFSILDEDAAPKKKGFSLGPSLIAQALFDETKGFHGDHGGSKTRPRRHAEPGFDDDLSDLPPEARKFLEAEKLAEAEAAGTVEERPGAGSGMPASISTEDALAAIRSKFGVPSSAVFSASDDATLDLGGIASGLSSSAGRSHGIPAAASSSAEVAWDFSGLGVTAEELSKKAAEDADTAAKLHAHEIGARVAKLSAEDGDTLKAKMAKQELSHKQRVRRVVEARRGSQFADRFTLRIAKQQQKQKARNKAKHA